MLFLFLYSFRLLRFVVVLGASVDLQALQAAIAQFVYGQHAANSVKDNLSRVNQQLLCQRALVQVTGVTAVSVVLLSVELVARYLQAAGIYDDDIVTAVDVSSYLRLALAE